MPGSLGGGGTREAASLSFGLKTAPSFINRAQHTVGTQECQLSSEMCRRSWDRGASCLEEMMLKTPSRERDRRQRAQRLVNLQNLRNPVWMTALL
ncbi:uncharacterized protein LOC120236280 isoform X4 [Hyaena hyaena]|uniref:uncharacterized protein LOC120236280 isoform X4 n=1 Tax=Hyaena hyaena TaxID=95912 RepID=UPI001924A75A|nr:uncharacterized protein LOC120236280 isoform X4 [Hyaena hyaena]